MTLNVSVYTLPELGSRELKILKILKTLENPNFCRPVLIVGSV